MQSKNPYKACDYYYVMETILGIDDAGRGPILGPMVLAGVLIDKKDEEILRNFGVKDSKLLNSKKRQEIAEKIKEKFDFHFELALPKEIDERAANGTNLNWIEAVKAAKIINTLSKKFPEKIKKVKVIIDCPSINTEKWGNYLLKYIDKPEKIKLVCEHKADLNYVCVSAASIIAKTTRDAEIDKLKKTFGEIGSGYASDPVTQKFLEKNMKKLEDAGAVRKSWDTYKKIMARKEQKGLF